MLLARNSLVTLLADAAQNVPKTVSVTSASRPHSGCSSHSSRATTWQQYLTPGRQQVTILQRQENPRRSLTILDEPRRSWTRRSSTGENPRRTDVEAALVSSLLLVRRQVGDCLGWTAACTARGRTTRREGRGWESARSGSPDSHRLKLLPLLRLLPPTPC